MNDFRRRFFSQVRLFPWCGGKSFPSSLRVSEKRTKKRAVSREKKQQLVFPFSSFDAGFGSSSSSSKKKKKKKKSHQR